jgi:hypothetical protein
VTSAIVSSVSVSAVRASGAPAGPGVYIVLGAVALVAGVFLAGNYRGLGTRYIRFTLRRTDPISPLEARLIKRYRFIYAITAVIGLGMIMSGISRL